MHPPGGPLLHLADETRDSTVTERHQAAVHSHIQRHCNGDARASGPVLAVHRGRRGEVRRCRAGDLVRVGRHGYADVCSEGEMVRVMVLAKK